MKENKKTAKSELQDENLISRRKAIKKMGLISLSAATMMTLLNTQSAKAASDDLPEAPTEPPSGGGGGSPIWN